MNLRRIYAVGKLLVRYIGLFFIAFPNRIEMKTRFKQIKVCFKVIFKNLFEKKHESY